MYLGSTGYPLHAAASKHQSAEYRIGEENKKISTHTHTTSFLQSNQTAFLSRIAVISRATVGFAIARHVLYRFCLKRDRADRIVHFSTILITHLLIFLIRTIVFQRNINPVNVQTFSGKMKSPSISQIFSCSA